VNESRGWRIALHAWSVIGAFVLASIVILPPAMVPDADAPPAIDDSNGDQTGLKGCSHSLAALPAQPCPGLEPLRAGPQAAGNVAFVACHLEIESALPTRAPPL